MERERMCVLVADSTRARIFEAKIDKSHQHLQGLEEKLDLINPRAQEGYSEHVAQTVTRKSGQSASGYDHRTADDDHSDRVFAKHISQQLSEYARAHKASHLILVAPPQFLGALRAHEKNLQKVVPNIREVPKELSGLTAPEIRNYLEKRAFH